MTKFLSIVVIIFLAVPVFAQSNIDSVTATAMRMIKKVTSENEALRKENLKLKSKANGLVKDKDSDKGKLLKALQQLYFNELQLEKNQAKLKALEMDLLNYKQENEQLKKIVADLQVQLKQQELARGDGKAYDSTIRKVLQHQSRVAIADKAKQNAEMDVYAGKSKTTVQSDDDVFLLEPLSFIKAGYHFPGIAVHAHLGGTYVKGRNLYVGLGTGYGEYESGGRFGTLPVFISGKAALISVSEGYKPAFLDEKESSVNDDLTIYVLCDIGYSFLVSKGQAPVSSGGLFLNTGFGSSGFVSNNLSWIMEVSFLRQSIRKFETEEYMRIPLNRFALRAGVMIYLR